MTLEHILLIEQLGMVWMMMGIGQNGQTNLVGEMIKTGTAQMVPVNMTPVWQTPVNGVVYCLKMMKQVV